VGAGPRRPAPTGRVGGQGDPARAAERAGAARDQGPAARDECIRLLAVRPRTRAELDTALRRRGYNDDVIAEVLDRYSDVGMIDDEAFARAWVTSRHHSKGLARRALAGELRRKGVADDDVGAALDDLDGDTEVETARTLVERRLRAVRSAPGRTSPHRTAALDGGPDAETDPDTEREERQRAQAALIRKLVGMLARKGYPPGLAYRVVKEALAAEAEVTGAESSGVAELLDLDSGVDDLDDFDQLRS
jgi:regulatory protein